MRVLVGVRVRLGLAFSVFLLLLLLLLGLARGFFALFTGKLLGLQLAFLELRLFQLSLLLGFLLLLIQFLLGGCRCFSAEILNLSLLLSHFHLSLFLFDDCLQLGLLHETSIGHHRPVAHGSGEVRALGHRGVRHSGEVGSGVRRVEDVALDASLLHLPLLTATSRTSFSSW